jgi:NhaA family Na+:H+ antiporter
VGELSSMRLAALPLAAAVGGMIVPALLYVAFNAGTPAVQGWAIPMATDIAFALGVLALLGKRAPLGLKIFLTALAIVDDLGAVLVIAFFYTGDLSFVSLMVAALFLLAMIGANRMHVRHPLVYLLLGIGLWVAVLLSGIHATIAGVVSALTIPARRRIDAEEFEQKGTAYMAEFREDLRPGIVDLTEDQRDAVFSLEEACEAVQTPLQRLEHMLHPWVAYFIMPVFALANAGVSLGAGLLASLANPIALGVGAGLVVGKQVGVLLFSWLAVRLGIASLPAGTRWSQLYGVACLCGIGFTMSLFIANLAFTDPATLDIAKTGILGASFVAGVIGYTVLRRTG